MINKNQKSKLNLLRKMSIIPVALVALYFFACNSNGSRKSSSEVSQPLSELTTTVSNIEEETEEETIPVLRADELPEFPGGVVALLSYISSNIKYPERALENNIQGRVGVQFVITSKGNIGEVRVTGSLDPELDAEAIRVIKTLPTFTPGKKGGVPVALWYQVPVIFQLR